jgi:hypothetical protein
MTPDYDVYSHIPSFQAGGCAKRNRIFQDERSGKKLRMAVTEHG